MYLSEISEKYNVPIGLIKEFFDKHNIPTLPYAHIDFKAIGLFEKNIELIKQNLQTENIQERIIEGPRILENREPQVETNYKLSKRRPRLITISRLLRTDIDKIIAFLIRKGCRQEELLSNTLLSKELFDQLKNEFDKSGLLKEDRFDFHHSSENPSKGSFQTQRKRIENGSQVYSSQRHHNFDSLLSIGRLLFFDYQKNKFGIIKDVKNAKNFNPSKVYVYEEGLKTTHKLFNNEIVVFILTKDQKGFVANNVKKISEIDIQDIEPYLSFVSAEEVIYVKGFPSAGSWQDIDDVTKNKLVKLFQKEKGVTSWYYLLKIGSVIDIDSYINQFLIDLNDYEKIQYLKKGNSEKLLEYTINNWKSNESNTLTEFADLFTYIEKNITIPDNLLNSILEAKLNMDEAWKLYSAFNDVRILQKIAEATTFENPSSISRLKSVGEEISKNKDWLQLIKSKFQEEAHNLKGSIIIDIFFNLKAFSLIPNDEKFMNLLVGKKLKINEFENLLVSYTYDPAKEALKRLMTSLEQKLSSGKLIELIEIHSSNTSIATSLIDEFIDLYSSADKIDTLISNIKSINGTDLLNYIITFHSDKLAKADAVNLLKLSIELKNIQSQKVAYSSIKIDSENKLVDLIEEFKILKLSKTVLDCNKPLSAFIELINEESIPAINADITQFIDSYSGIVQCFLIKNLIYKANKKKISFEKLTAIFNSIRWTEISAILIHAFISAKNHSERFLLEKLNEVFKEHFQVLLSEKINSDSFKQTFTIKNIVPKCDGRKHYEAELWRGNGINRWYYNDYVSIHKYMPEAFYCEGRPWKKEPLWDSATNRPTAKQYEFYWCRGGYCAQRNDTLDFQKPFYEWTIIEISAFLGINLEKLTIANLAGWINRMNEIIDRLVCRSCNEVLRPFPFNPKTLGFYAVPMFQCINEQCDMNKQPIRFTHCLNGRCGAILDSRDCEKCCSYGLICNHCSSKCPRCVGLDSGVIVEQTW